MEELYINDILIELKSNTVSQTLQINDIGELKDRQSNYSNNIKIPKTPSNISAFDFLGVAGNGTRYPYDNVVVKYVVNGIELISGGKGVIKNTNAYFNLVVYDGNISMTDLLGDKQMNGLDFSAYNHQLTSGLFLSSFTNTSGYIYALAKFYKFDTSAYINISYSTPSFYVHTLFEMIFSQKGYTISGDIFSDLEYKSKLTSMSSGYDRQIINDFEPIEEYIRNNTLDPDILETYTSVTSSEFIIDSFTAGTDGSREINIDGKVQIRLGVDFYISLKINGTEFSRFDVTRNVSFDESQFVNAFIGDDISISIGITSEENPSNSIQTVDFSTEYITTSTTNNPYINVAFEDMIGESLQIDFVKDIMQRYGLIFRKTKNENNFEFIQLSKLLEDYDNAEDWSDKYSDFLNEEYKSSYAQTNKIKYKYDDNDSDTEQTWADGEFYVDNVNLSDEKTLFTSTFKASELSGINILYQLDQWEFKNSIGVVPKDDGLRMFKKTIISDTISLKFSDAEDNTFLFSGVIPYLDFNTVDYQCEIDNNYQQINKMLDDYHKLKINSNINIVDVYNVDFFKLKYFNQLGAYYYLNKVVSFKPNKKTKIELIKVGEKIFVSPTMEGISNGTSSVVGDLSSYVLGSIRGESNGTSFALGNLIDSSLTPFDTTTLGYSSLTVCAQTLDIVRYHNALTPEPINGATIYEDAAGLIPFNGGGDYYKSNFTDKIRISSAGEVSLKASC